jgi:hypothetical protein
LGKRLAVNPQGESPGFIVRDPKRGGQTKVQAFLDWQANSNHKLLSSVQEKSFV